MSKQINLLPLARRRRLARQFFERALLRFVKSAWLALGTVTVAAVVAIVLLQVLGSLLFRSVGNELDDAVVTYRVETKSIVEQNKLIKEMDKLQQERLVWSELFDDVLTALPPGTKLKDINGSVESKQIVVAGEAVARSSLVVLQEKLANLPWVASVDAPHSNLLERDNPSFTFLIKL